VLERVFSAQRTQLKDTLCLDVTCTTVLYSVCSTYTGLAEQSSSLKMKCTVTKKNSIILIYGECRRNTVRVLYLNCAEHCIWKYLSRDLRNWKKKSVNVLGQWLAKETKLLSWRLQPVIHTLVHDKLHVVLESVVHVQVLFESFIAISFTSTGCHFIKRYMEMISTLVWNFVTLHFISRRIIVLSFETFRCLMKLLPQSMGKSVSWTYITALWKSALASASWSSTAMESERLVQHHWRSYYCTVLYWRIFIRT
jgi:hypothetical protein